MELRQPVRGRGRELRMWMLEPVPARVIGRITQPEIRPEVDHRGPVTRDLGDARRGRAVGQRQEHGVRLGQRRIDGQARPLEMAVGVLDRLLIAIPALQSHQLHIRVARQDADELGTHVAGRADDRDADATLRRRRQGRRARNGGGQSGGPSRPEPVRRCPRSRACEAPHRGQARGSDRMDRRHGSYDYTHRLHTHATR